MGPPSCRSCFEILRPNPRWQRPGPSFLSDVNRKRTSFFFSFSFFPSLLFSSLLHLSRPSSVPSLRLLLYLSHSLLPNNLAIGTTFNNRLTTTIHNVCIRGFLHDQLDCKPHEQVPRPQQLIPLKDRRAPAVIKFYAKDHQLYSDSWQGSISIGLASELH